MTQTQTLIPYSPSSPAPQLDDPAAYIREAFVTLAAAFPSAKSDETYWTLLARTFAKVPDAYLNRAVQTYIDRTEFHVLPTIGELKKLVESAKYSLAAAAVNQATEIGHALSNLARQRKDALIRAIPAEDRRTVEAIIQHCFTVAPSYGFALTMIPRYLDLSDGPDLGDDIGWSPTGILADSLIPTPAQYAQGYSKPYPLEAVSPDRGGVKLYDLTTVPPPPIVLAKGLNGPFSVRFNGDLELTRMVSFAEAFDEWAKTQATDRAWGHRGEGL